MATIDILSYLKGDGRAYEVSNSWGGAVEVMRTELDPQDSRRFFHAKNELWEELWSYDDKLYRGTDTSPGAGEVYELCETGKYGSIWLGRYGHTGQTFKRMPTVTFRYKATGQQVVTKPPYLHTSWMRIEAIHNQYTFRSGITLENVLELGAYNGQPARESRPFERYFYAQKYGLVGWKDNGIKQSYISKIDTILTIPPREILPWFKPTLIAAEPIKVLFPARHDVNWTVNQLKANQEYANVRAFPTTNSISVGKITNTPEAFDINYVGKADMSDGTWYPIAKRNTPTVNNPDAPIFDGWVRSDVIVVIEIDPIPAPELLSFQMMVTVTLPDTADMDAIKKSFTDLMFMRFKAV